MKSVVATDQRERDYCSTNQSISNISPCSNWNLFEFLKSSEHEKLYDAIQVINPPIFLIVLKFFGWSPNFNLLSIKYILHPLALVLSYYNFVLCILDLISWEYTIRSSAFSWGRTCSSVSWVISKQTGNLTSD